MSADTRIPGLPWDPRMVGPVDLLGAAIARTHSWASEHSRELLAASTVVLVAQVAVYAHNGTVFLRLPTLPNWMLVAIGGVIVATPYAVLGGILLARGLYQSPTTMLSTTNPSTGDQEIEHVATDRFRGMTIKNQNGETKDRTYLQKVLINGREAWEVDSIDEENDVLVASSMAGRTDREIRADRRAIPRIKKDLEARADEAEELIINFRDIMRDHAVAVSNRIVRTAQGISVPGGEDLFDDLRSDLDAVDPLADLKTHTHREDDAGGDQDGEPTTEAALDEKSNTERVLDIFERAEAAPATDGGRDE